MTKQQKTDEEAAELRRRAQAQWSERKGSSPPFIADEDTLRLLHELEVHQIELEIQNTELERLQDEKAAALEKFTDLYDSAPMAYLTVDAQGAITAANLAVEDLLGGTRESLMNRTVSYFLAAKSRALFTRFLESVFSSRVRQRCIVTVVRSGLPVIEVEMDGIASSSGSECRIALSDITERNRIAEDRLVLSKLESVGLLAGGIAHDFNNLLLGIVFNLDLANEYAPAIPELKQCLENAKRTAMSARDLSHRFLTLSKGSALRKHLTDVKALVRSAARVALSGSNIECSFDFAANLRDAYLDQNQFSQVVRNILLNARESMPEGGRIAVSANNVSFAGRDTSKVPPGEYIQVSFADQGVGISSENLLRIFDPYFSTKTRGDLKGMGLGLTISHNIVQRHGGAITVESSPGTGTRFDVYVPSSSERANVSEIFPLAPTVTTGTLLVMDDDPEVREVCGKILRRMGHTVVLAENGEQAVTCYSAAKAEGNPIEAVILDLTIRNGMGGVRTMQELQKIDPAVQAIVMSGFSEDPIIERYVEHGFAGALVKPFGFETLQALLAKVLTSARM